MTDSPPASAESQGLAAPPASTRVIVAATLAWTLGLLSYWAQPGTGSDSLIGSNLTES